MARYLDVHPANPQPRLLAQAAQVIRDGGMIAYPTDSGFALGCRMGDKDALDRIKRLRRLDDKHHFTLMVSEFAHLGHWVEMDNWEFRAIKAATPGPYTFILRATRDLPKAMLHPKKKTVGVRIPQHVTALALLEELGEPLTTSSLILPDEEDPMTDGWTIADSLGHEVDLVLDSGDVGVGPTTVVDFTGEQVRIARHGSGDPSPFEE
ncbi:L-threonylcarbamoyladenylate synthase [Luteococcus sp. OSA5]|uniref:L-threonylcarbamoyladenylate synthase n=1 Tax=Luteococcus sp. OSA5 TaxID=3401630 RepID=UPI003B438DCC